MLRSVNATRNVIEGIFKPTRAFLYIRWITMKVEAFERLRDKILRIINVNGFMC